MEYQCQHCSYKFEASRKPYSCPYCGDIGHVIPMPSAVELLEEVSKEKKKEEKQH